MASTVGVEGDGCSNPIYEAARDETAALTEQIAKIEAQIDARVAVLDGLDIEDQRSVSPLCRHHPH